MGHNYEPFLNITVTPIHGARRFGLLNDWWQIAFSPTTDRWQWLFQGGKALVKIENEPISNSIQPHPTHTHTHRCTNQNVLRRTTVSCVSLSYSFACLTESRQYMWTSTHQNSANHSDRTRKRDLWGHASYIFKAVLWLRLRGIKIFIFHGA